MGYHLLDEPELAQRHYEWVREIIETHKNDERICMWDIYNEVGNAKREEATMPHLKKFFEIAREILQQCKAEDWKLACLEWLSRREKAVQAKLLAA